MSKRSLSPNEKRAWARVAKTVRTRPGVTPAEMPPLDEESPVKKGSDKSPVTTPYQRAKTPQRAKLEKPARAPIANRGRERRIRRGQAEISATLDLHGHTQESAQHLLVNFLTTQRRIDGGCVLVITGKGRRGEGVLRRRLLDWLGTGEARALVSGYASAHRKHGGSGAWYLFLRKLPENRL